MHLLAAPDKFRGSATGAEIAAAIAEAATEARATCEQLPLADGGEGLLEVFGGPNRVTEVTGPLGRPVQAGWRLDEQGRAVIESAQVCGLLVAGGKGAFDPVAASTTGVGELIAEAFTQGAGRVLVGLGGSATTDGGFGAVQALLGSPAVGDVPSQNLRGRVTVCCDVTTRFNNAADVFAPQKGATPAQVGRLTERLTELAAHYEDEFGVTVTELVGSGAAGGLAGGLAALGARLASGFDAVADELGLPDALDRADLVVTGEGQLDETSLRGKVVGGVLSRAARAGKPVLVIVGSAELALPEGDGRLVSLTEVFGQRKSFAHPQSCVKKVVLDVLAEQGVGAKSWGVRSWGAMPRVAMPRLARVARRRGRRDQ